MSGAETIAMLALAGFVGFIVYKVVKSRNKKRGGGGGFGGGGGRPSDPPKHRR